MLTQDLNYAHLRLNALPLLVSPYVLLMVLSQHLMQITLLPWVLPFPAAFTEVPSPATCFVTIVMTFVTSAVYPFWLKHLKSQPQECDYHHINFQFYLKHLHIFIVFINYNYWLYRQGVSNMEHLIHFTECIF